MQKKKNKKKNNPKKHIKTEQNSFISEISQLNVLYYVRC